MLVQHGYKSEIVIQSVDFSESDVWLWMMDGVKDRVAVVSVVSQLPVDVILLCNLGGNLDPNFYKHEAELFLKYGFTEDEIS